MKKIVALLLIATMGFVLIACNAMNTVSPQVNENSALSSAPEEVLSETKEADTAIDFSEAEISIILTVENYNFHATLLNFKTTAELIDLLPFILFYPDTTIPTEYTPVGLY